MYVLYDKQSGFARVTCTENPVISCKLLPNWYENYVLEEFAHVDMIYLNEYFVKIENNKIKVIGRIQELMNKKLQYRYDGFSPLFVGE